MAKSKKASHNKFTLLDRTFEKSEVSHDSDNVEIFIPKDMPYVKVRRALEFALLRIS
jgi:hypothetical protein